MSHHGIDLATLWAEVQTQLAELTAIPKTGKNIKRRKGLAENILDKIEAEPLCFKSLIWLI